VVALSVNVFFIATLLANGMWGGQMPGTAGTTMDELIDYNYDDDEEEEEDEDEDEDEDDEDGSCVESK